MKHRGKHFVDLTGVVNGGWAVVNFCLNSYNQGIELTEVQLKTLREVQSECGEWLGRIEDGPAVTKTCPSLRRSLRHVEQSATDLLAAIAEAGGGQDGHQEGSGKDR